MWIEKRREAKDCNVVDGIKDWTRLTLDEQILHSTADRKSWRATFNEAANHRINDG